MRPLPLLLVALLPGCEKVLYSSGCDDPRYEPQTTPVAYSTREKTVAAAAGEGGELDAAECAVLCEQLTTGERWIDVTGCTAVESGDTGAGMTVTCEGTWEWVCKGGRPPRGTLTRTRRARGTARGRWLGRMATMEAASVLAFQELADDLERLGAPAELVEAARAGAADEVRHARAMTTLARSFGGSPPRVKQTGGGGGDLTSVAEHNAAAGCVAEMWAAALAVHQALHAPAEMRPTFEGIARDEVRHAELAWAIHRWALSAGADRARVEAAMRASVAAVQADASRRSPTGLGLPTPARARQLAARLEAELWA